MLAALLSKTTLDSGKRPKSRLKVRDLKKLQGQNQKNTESGTWNEHDRIANSDFIFAANEVCGPVAYNGKGVTAAWPRIAKPAKM